MAYNFISCYSQGKVQTDFFSGYDETTESVKQKFERTNYVIYCTVRNALSTDCIFLSR